MLKYRIKMYGFNLKGGIGMGWGRRPLTKIELIINSSILIIISLIVMMPLDFIF